MDYKTEVRRNQIIIVFLLAAFILGCGGLIGFGNLKKSILFALPFFILLPTGCYYIVKQFEGKKQFIFFSLWISFVFALTAAVGMLIDPRTFPINWFRILAFSGISWLVTFLFILLMSPLYSKTLRTWKEK